MNGISPDIVKAELMFGVFMLAVLFVVLPIAAKVTADARRAKAARERAELEEAPAKAFVWLLKYIAVADRSFSEGERQFILLQMREIFPAHRIHAASVWMEQVKPDPYYLDAVLAAFVKSPLENRQNLMRALEAVAMADGKTTKAEKERLMVIRERLGV